jgi:hypothetical protein
MNSLVTSLRSKRDLSDSQRKRQRREILETYKKQILEKEQRDRKKSDNKKIIERVLIEKQSVIDSHKIDEEKLISLKKKA